MVMTEGLRLYDDPDLNALHGGPSIQTQTEERAVEIEMEWSEPPPDRKYGDSDIARLFVAELRRRPGEWAKFPKPVKHHAAAGYWRAKFPDIEWVARKVDGKIGVWARAKES